MIEQSLKFSMEIIFSIFVLVKLKAFILVVCAVAYLAEWLAMPGRMGTPAAASSELCPGKEIRAEKPMCCQKAVNGTVHSGCPKPGKGCNEVPNCCLDCPLCYLTILPFAQEETGPAAIGKKLYPVFRETCAYGYHADAWKPPNTA